MKTEGADPELSSNVDLAVSEEVLSSERGFVNTLRAIEILSKCIPVGVENGTARRFAGNWLVQHGRKIFTLLQRRIKS